MIIINSQHLNYLSCPVEPLQTTHTGSTADSWGFKNWFHFDFSVNFVRSFYIFKSLTFVQTQDVSSHSNTLSFVWDPLVNHWVNKLHFILTHVKPQQQLLPVDSSKQQFEAREVSHFCRLFLGWLCAAYMCLSVLHFVVKCDNTFEPSRFKKLCDHPVIKNLLSLLNLYIIHIFITTAKSCSTCSDERIQ